MNRYGSIANDSTSAAEAQNKKMRDYLNHHARKNEKFELVDTLKQLWLFSSKKLEENLKQPRTMK